MAAYRSIMMTMRLASRDRVGRPLGYREQAHSCVGEAGGVPRSDRSAWPTSAKVSVRAARDAADGAAASSVTDLAASRVSPLGATRPSPARPEALSRRQVQPLAP